MKNTGIIFALTSLMASPHERKVLTFEFSKMHSLKFDEDTKLFIISGEILYEYYRDYRTQSPVNVIVLNKSVMFDYFSPSFGNIFLDKGINIKN